MMHAAPRGIAGADGGLERSSCQPRIDRAADGITYDPTGPRIEGDSQVHEAGRDGDIGDVSHPKLVRTIQCHGRRKIGAIGSLWSLSVVAMKRLRGCGLSACSRISRRTFLAFTTRPR